MNKFSCFHHFEAKCPWWLLPYVYWLDFILLYKLLYLFKPSLKNLDSPFGEGDEKGSVLLFSGKRVWIPISHLILVADKTDPRTGHHLGHSKRVAMGSVSTPASQQVQLTNLITSSCWALIPSGTLNPGLLAATSTEPELTHMLNIYLPALEYWKE